MDDDSHFLGSMMGDTVLAQPAADPAPPPATAPPPSQIAPPPKKRRGRPPRNGTGPLTAAAPTAAARQAAARKKEEDDEEVVCFICFDGGDLVVCDRRWVGRSVVTTCVRRGMNQPTNQWVDGCSQSSQT
jgi:hypothetical protein